MMGLLDSNGYIDSGSILYDGRDLTVNRTDKDWQKIRGKEIAMVFQDPMTSLNPLKTIGQQVQEAVELHQGLKGELAYKAVLEALTDVGIDDPVRRYKQYPHEFSGGMRWTHMYVFCNVIYLNFVFIILHNIVNYFIGVIGITD